LGERLRRAAAKERKALEAALEAGIKAAIAADGTPCFADAAAGLAGRGAGCLLGLWEGGYSEGVSPLIARAGAGALLAGLDGMIEAIDLRSVAEERIGSMDTRGIERVFRSFAGRYIRRIKLYSIWGGVFGIHPLIPAASFAAALAKSVAARIGLAHNKTRPDKRRNPAE
jgi:uncharacterized membrane protein YheB (UPF0754 family)